jgi:DNA-directed RNA polymerase specialized sigma24 family protein
VNAETTGGGRGVLGGTAGDGWGRCAAYDAYADGLHTYALWYLRDHDAAADAVYCAFAAADRNHTTLQQPEQIQPWLYALLRRECRLRAAEPDAPEPVSGRLRPKADGLGESGVGASLLALEGNLRRAEFHSLAWPEAEGLAPAHREVLELTIRHGLDSRGLALVLGLREGAAGLASTRGFGLLADAWRELERSLAAAAVAGSGRENCAQLAELTFGWSGKLNATLRAPLTEHVDRCSRCQHYLHTVIGTPSAPTILPYVAAPRALRDLLLGELADAETARLAEVDLVALGRRCGEFGPEGFPGRVDLSQGSMTSVAGPGAGPGAGAGPIRSPRRRHASARQYRAQRSGAGVPTSDLRPQPVDDGRADAASAQPTAPTAAAAIAPTPTFARPPAPSSARTSTPSAPDAPRGAKPASEPLPVLAPQTSRTYQSSQLSQTPNQGPQGAPRSRAPLPSPPRFPGPDGIAVRPPTRVPPRLPDAEELFRARGSWAERVLPPQPSPDAASAAAFVQTPSGRFATRLPARPRPAAASASAGSAAPGIPGVPAAASATRAPGGTTRLPRYTRNGGGCAGVRPRHKARPMRQAVVSAMALGAIGAVAAAAAALLGATGNPHTNNTALDNPQSSEVTGSLGTPAAARSASRGGMSVTVTAGGAASSQAATTPLGLPLVGTSTGSDASSPAASASASASAVTAGGFYVSVNQRDGDPYSVQILLRNAGTAPLSWSATPNVSWLTLSRGSGTLAPGQSLAVTATATSAAPSGQWSAQIAFQPGGVLATVHGGIPSGSPSAAPTGSTPSSGGSPSASATGGATPASPSAAPSTTSSSPSTPPATTVAPSAPPPRTPSHPAMPSQSGSGTASQPTPTVGATTPAASGSATPSG